MESKIGISNFGKSVGLGIFLFKFILITVIRFIFPLWPNHDLFAIFVGDAAFFSFIILKITYIMDHIIVAKFSTR